MDNKVKYIILKREYAGLFEEMCSLLAENHPSEASLVKTKEINDGLHSYVSNSVDISNAYIINRKLCFYQNNKRNREIIDEYFQKMEFLRDKIKALFEEIYKRKPKYIRDVEQPKIIVPGKKLKYTVRLNVDKKGFDSSLTDEIKERPDISEYIYQEYRINKEYRVSTNNTTHNILSGILIPVEVGETVSFSAVFKGCEIPEEHFRINGNDYYMKKSVMNGEKGKAALEELKLLHELYESK